MGGPDPDAQEKAFEAAKRLPKEVNERNKQAALQACAGEHAELLQCFLDGKPYWECYELSKAFWACYSDQRGFTRSVLATWLPSPSGEQAAKPTRQDGGD
mmetsp:Transcript_37706/g.97843  ORF Transcript_37706/g.97843 Transcript_37706/m.97843 type:complete len:100 (-) Transcript_37706:111-410(-)|eukprot:jgi/Tetstr1/426138/TSEL_016466.t1